ncbi:hypothetical protein PTKIN_Ptkin19aG0130400 [Pterospermum kingtungense]
MNQYAYNVVAQLNKEAFISVKLQQLTKEGIDCGVSAKRLALSLQKKNLIIDGIGEEIGVFTKLTNMNEKIIIPNGDGGFGVIEIPNSQAQSMNCQFGIKEMGLGLDGKQAVNHNDSVPLHGVDLPLCKISGFIIPNDHRWDIDALETCFDEATMSAILQIPLSRFNQHDCLIWIDSAIGMFSVRSAYYVVREILVDALCRRGMVTDPLCKVCLHSSESWFHMLFTCELAIKTWNFSLPWVNDLVAGIAKLAQRLKIEYLAVENSRSVHRLPKHLRWSFPPHGSIKVNVDVAWNPSDKCAVSSCVAWDDSARKDDNVDSVLHGKLLASRFGCELVLFKDLSCVLLESDSLLAVKEVHNVGDSLCQWGGLVIDVATLARLLSITNIVHVNLEANSCVHELAKMSKLNRDYSCWVGGLCVFCCNPDSN